MNNEKLFEQQWLSLQLKYLLISTYFSIIHNSRHIKSTLCLHHIRLVGAKSSCVICTMCYIICCMTHQSTRPEAQKLIRNAKQLWKQGSDLS